MEGGDVTIRAAICALSSALALALAACGVPPPHPGFTQQEFIVPRPADGVFNELQAHMATCRQTNSLFGRADVDGSFDAATHHGRVVIVREGRVLWGAEVLGQGKGTRVLAYASLDVEADHYEWLMQRWLTPPPFKAGIFPEC